MTFKVTRTDDPAPGRCKQHDCSLREAILAANAHPGDDTVELQGGKTYNLQIPGTSEDAGLTGDLDVHDALTLEAVGGGRATINGNALDRVIDIFKPTTLLRLEITGGNPGNFASGGGIQSDAPTRIVSSKVDGNTAYYNGGGVRATGGLQIIHSTISGNSSGSEGGGVLANQAMIDHSRIVDNTTTSSCGGASLSGTTPTIEHSVFSGNHANSDGGGLCVRSSGSATITVVDSLFTDNTTNTNGGGALIGVVRGTIARRDLVPEFPGDGQPLDPFRQPRDRIGGRRLGGRHRPG